MALTAWLSIIRVYPSGLALRTCRVPMIPEALFAMLACARLGAIHSVVFGGFAAPNLAARIDDAKPVLIVTADAGARAHDRRPQNARPKSVRRCCVIPARMHGQADEGGEVDLPGFPLFALFNPEGPFVTDTCLRSTTIR